MTDPTPAPVPSEGTPLPTPDRIVLACRDAIQAMRDGFMYDHETMESAMDALIRASREADVTIPRGSNEQA